MGKRWPHRPTKSQAGRTHVPFVTVHMWEGRSVEQKRALAKAITDAMVEHVDAKPDALHVVIQEYSLENWARGGVLGIDRTNA
jgi:4-oxalocrotonate tautomerase